jgi:hypothetical protein
LSIGEARRRYLVILCIDIYQAQTIMVLGFLIYWAVLNQTFYLHSVDWSGWHEDSCGSTGQGRPRRSAATRRLPGTPAESEVPGAPINRLMNSAHLRSQNCRYIEQNTVNREIYYYFIIKIY